ncbi:TonB-dependent receptor [uncultured Algimonas sp.]|uniref:TonB-dependent receptor n=1 Tax=uncultured Algimonas sp. TaxID=1547920 RepID=UPI00261FA738|nr:TonB-dependent receptor [uncultured Algimonas sp.]
MSKSARTSLKSFYKYNRILTSLIVATTVSAMGSTAYAQQSGSVTGIVTEDGGLVVPGVTIEARSPVLPGIRTAVTDDNGRYQLPLLPPGEYEFTFIDPNGSITRRSASVLLQQRRDLDIVLGGGDEIIVVGQRIELETGSGSLKNSITNDIITGVPVGQQYRDLQKLIPGVQYSEDEIRGPSAGGSGQDNVYQFDGVDVSLPLFGNLSAEPSTHDIDQVTIVRGGATAKGFNRAGGFKINTISKRGTDEFKGEVGYQVQTAGMTSQRKNVTNSDFDEDRSWITANIGGPVLKEKLYFYGSYFRPTINRVSASNALGDVPDFESTRDEYFGKLTFAPISNLTLDASYRTSDREDINASIGAFDSPTTSEGATSSQDIAIAEVSWIIDNESAFNFRFNDYALKTSSRPDTIFSVTPVEGQALDINALNTLGFFRVPTLRDGTTAEDLAFNAFAQPVITQYGVAGSGLGGATTIDDIDFFRTSFEASYSRNFSIGGMNHEIHIGYQHMEIKEVLERSSNGFGFISVPGGTTTTADGTPIFYQARLTQPAPGGAGQTLTSSSILQSFEINDTIETGRWTINVGALISKDILYGQGLANDSSTLSGFVLSPGTKYKMYTTDWGKMIQPRLGVNYDFSDTVELYANYARYNPSASSLARAASWDRRVLSKRTDFNYDANGNFLNTEDVGSSSGKLFVPDMDPRYINEYLVGVNKQFTDNLNIRLHARHREAGNFWEDTNNDARLIANAPADIQALGLYIPNLDEQRLQIGNGVSSGSSYVVATLDNSFTKYYEVGLEGSYTGDDFSLTGSYVWSRYRGNFDQDNTSGNNDQNIFIGSSNLADGPGRQLWDLKEGTLAGDRPHQFKVYGVYNLPWDASVGGFAVFQSGQPWETWDFRPYSALTRSQSTTIRFSEPAGSNRSDSHFQADLNYTQNIRVFGDYSVQLRADLFNIFNSQTGYNIQPRFNAPNFGEPLRQFRPRRLQLGVKAKF